MRTVPLCFSVSVLLLALSLVFTGGCGNNGHVCPLSNSGCGCGLTQTSVCHGPTPQEFLFASGDARKVLSMPINVTTGALGMAASVDGPQMSFGLTAGVNASGVGMLYASDFRNAEIDGFSINLSSGLLSPLASFPFSTGTLSVLGGLSLNPQSNFIYAADAGKIDAFAVDPTTGLLTAVPGSPFSSGTNLQVLVDPTGRFLYATDLDPPNGVFAFTIDATGALTPVGGSPFPFPGQTVLNSQPFGLATAFGGKFLYVTVTGTNQIAAYAIDQTTGALTNVPGSPFTAGNQPTFVVVANNFVYTVNSHDETLSAYTIDATTGALSSVTGSPFPVDAPAGLAIDALGTHLYVAAPALSEIFAFTINTDGSLTPIAGSPFPATGAALLTIFEAPST